MQHMYKNQLQTYSQKRGLGLPEYACKREGLPHACRFSCKVTVAEETYESPELYNTLKEAEHAAAKVALMALCPCGVPEDNSFVYKNLLQELAQKEFFCLPTYSAIVCGLPHMPTFVSTVEVKGEIFQGEIAKTKKQAEMNAAKVAYLTIKQRGLSQSHEVIPTTCQLQEATSSSLKPTLTVDLQENVRLKSPLVLNMNVLPKEENEDLIKKEDNEERAGDQKASKKMSVNTLQAHIPCMNPSSTRKRGASDIPYDSLQNLSPSVPSSSEGGPPSCISDTPTDVKLEQPTETGTLQCKKVCVLPHTLKTKFSCSEGGPSSCISDMPTEGKFEQPIETNTVQCKKVCVLPRTLKTKVPDSVIGEEKWVTIETGLEPRGNYELL